MARVVGVPLALSLAAAGLLVALLWPHSPGHAPRTCAAHAPTAHALVDVGLLDAGADALLDVVRCACGCQMGGEWVRGSLLEVCTAQLDASQQVVCAEAAYALGNVHLHNRSNAVTAARVYQLAAFRGSAQASFRLGALLTHGHSNHELRPSGAPMRPDRARGRRMFHYAAALGHVDAIFNLAIDAQLSGDWDAASTWYARAVLQGDIEAMSVLGGQLADGSKLPLDIPAAATLLYCAALRGSTNAATILKHMMRRYGRVVLSKYTRKEFCGEAAAGAAPPQEFRGEVMLLRAQSQQAVQLVDGAALNSQRFPVHAVAPPTPDAHAEALDNGAALERMGRVDEALAVYRDLAATTTLPEPLIRMSKIFRRGARGTSPDLGRAVDATVRALRLGSTEAVFQAALVLEALQLKASALEMYSHAAAAGHKDALFNLGFMYQNGSELVPLDEHESLHFYTEAAKCGDAEAMYQAALVLMRDDVVPSDPVTAHAFLNVAFSRGILCAESDKMQLERQMSTADIVQANTHAREVRKWKRCDVGDGVQRREVGKALELLLRVQAGTCDDCDGVWRT